MGWNTGYTIFEATVIGAYNLGKLDKAMLKVLMEPYRGTDIDNGGGRDLTTKDGKGVEQVVIEVWGMKCPAKPAKNANAAEWDDYWEKIGEKFCKVTDHFGWR